MSTYLITYDLRSPGRDYSALYERIKTYGTWIHVVESVWEVNTTQSAAAVRDNLTAVMDSNDRIFVTVVGPEAAWRGLTESASDWLKKNHGE